MKYLPHKIILYQLYIFQLEEYDSNRFVNALINKGLLPGKKLRNKAKLTKKAIILLLLDFLQKLLITIILGYLLLEVINNLAVLISILIIILYLFYIFSFVFLTQAKLLLSPLDHFAKRNIVKKAKAKLSTMDKLVIIGITGSYGKTTMKETLYEFLNEQYKVVKTEGNNNTPIGISRTILNKVNRNTEIFIVEMGEYVKGDVKELCEIATPDISIITGINEAHLERYKTMENAISTKFEIVEFAKQDAQVLLNADDKLTMENYKKYTKNNSVQFYSSKNHELCAYSISEYSFDQNGKGQEFKLTESKGDVISIKTQVLGEYIIGNIVAGFIIGEKFNIPLSKLKYVANNLKPVEHRLQTNYNLQNNIVVIDDTYNGNSDGFKEGVNILSKFKMRRKVYVTPGLAETGELAEPLHLEIGRNLSKVADIVILVKNSVTKYIYKGLIDSGFKEENVIWYDNSKDVWEELNSNVKNGDVVMLQNDWSDNYY